MRNSPDLRTRAIGFSSVFISAAMVFDMTSLVLQILRVKQTLRRAVTYAFPRRYLRHPIFVLASFERSFEVRRELVILKRLRIAPNLKPHEIILVNGGLIEIVSKVSWFRARRRCG